MKFSKSLAIASLFLSVSSFSQTVAPMGGAPEGILFRGMPNVIQITDNSGENREFDVQFTGGSIEIIEANDKNSAEGRYILRASTANLTPEVIILDKEGTELNRVAFKAQRRPDSDIKFATESGEFSKNVKQLVVSNHYSYFEKMEEIVSWKITVDGIVLVEDKGSRLSDQAMYKLSKLAPGTNFELETFVLDFDGIGRKKNSTFTTD